MRQTRREFIKTTGVVAATAGLASVESGPYARAQPKPAKRPNILFFFPDQHRYDWLSWNAKLPLKTPNLDKLAARGVRFDNAVTPSPLCAPARACLASGKEYDRCGVPSNAVDYPLEQTTFYKLLRDGGYHVMGCGKFDLHKGSPIWGLDGKNRLPEWGFSDGIDNGGKQDAVASSRNGPKEPYTAYLQSRGLLDAHREDFGKRSKSGHAAAWPTPLPDDAYMDNWVANNGLQLIRNAPEGKPWFIQVNFPGPHPPWDITESMTALYDGVDFSQPNGGGQLTPQQHVAVRRNYSAMITNIDRWLGVYVQELEKRGELANTLIVYSSDHGEMLGDHDQWGKSSPFQPSVGVPLIVAGPEVAQGVVSDALASTVDLAATFVEYAGLVRPADMDSLSLKPVLEGKAKVHRECLFSALRSWRMVFDGRYKTIRGFGSKDKQDDPPPILFDLKDDPLENVNLAKTG